MVPKDMSAVAGMAKEMGFDPDATESIHFHVDHIEVVTHKRNAKGNKFIVGCPGDDILSDTVIETVYGKVGELARETICFGYGDDRPRYTKAVWEQRHRAPEAEEMNT